MKHRVKNIMNFFDKELWNNNKKYCSGCYACYSVCPQNCISMCTDEEGFNYPCIDESICVNCGLCERICPINILSKLGNIPIDAYAVINNKTEERLNSSSGGIFCLLAEYVNSQRGVVFGAKFDGEFNVVHDFAEEVEDLSVFYGSKYVQSVIGDTYITAKTFLEKGKFVLFSGTPCQIAGLKAFLGKDYDNLWTVDVLCHGVPSPKVWKKYISYHRTMKGMDIEKVSFRDKKFGWNMFSMVLQFTDESLYRKVMLEDMYMQGFLKNLYLRASCYNCKFKGEVRFGDVSLGDFWGIDAIFPELNDDKGVSLLLLNSIKGQKMLQVISEAVELKQTPMEALTKYNSVAVNSVEEPSQRSEFFKDLKKLEAGELFLKYCKYYCETDMRAKMLLIERRLKENHPCIVQAFVQHFSNIDKGIYLWGSGRYGEMMSQYLQKHGIKVKAFIDNNMEKVGQVINGVQIISFTELKDADANIFVAVASCEISESIKEQVNNKYQSINILTFDRLYGYKSIKGLLWE